MRPINQWIERVLDLTPRRRSQHRESVKVRSIFNGLSPETRSTLVAGPFVGEFGWEVAQWQGYVRYLSRFYQRTIAISREENIYLYKDFAKEFITHDPGSYETDFYNCRTQRQFTLPVTGDIDHLDPQVVGPYLSSYLNQEFFVYGQSDSAEHFDVVVHGRFIPPQGALFEKASRNWSVAQWESLCELLHGEQLRVAAIGIPSLSVCPDGVADLRAKSLKIQCQILRHCGVCVGPSSGAMHLASHSNCPVVIWTDRHSGSPFGGVANRYMFSWNPHRTDAIAIIDDVWSPKPQFVFRQIMDILEAKGAGQRVHRIVESR